ncbi:MAG: hypothetical protein R3C56_29625 [Pirellulaceae bacterium]
MNSSLWCRSCERAKGGGVIGSFPLTGIRISLIGGEMREVGSDEVAFRMAANDAFDAGLQASSPTLLEPVMRLDIVTPDDYMGEIVGDLQQRRATIESTESRGVMTAVIADARSKSCSAIRRPSARLVKVEPVVRWSRTVTSPPQPRMRRALGCKWPMRYLELTLPSIAENLMLDEALLDEAQASDVREETLRIWQAHSPFVVLGRSSRVDDEVDQACTAEQSVPIFRRVSGGATVVAGPGCMFYALVLSARAAASSSHARCRTQFVMGSLQSALKSLLPQLEFDGTCDLVVSGRKVSGNSVRLVRDWMLYHGTLLLDMDLTLAERLLKHPPRARVSRRS